MLIVNLVCLILCAYWVARDTTWTWQWWVSGLGVVFNAYPVFSVISKI